jgi:hypothetical protein
MKLKPGFLAVACLLIPAAVALAADPDLTKWSQVAHVEFGQQPAKGLVEVELTPEMFAKSRPDLADLRVTTPAGTVVPCVIRVDRGQPGRSVSYPAARLFNPVYVPGKQSTVTVDFGNRAPRSRIDVDTPGTNFRRRVSVEAGADDQSWQVLKASDWLFRIHYANGSYNKAEVTLPDNDFRYLRLTVFNAPDDPDQVPIQSVTAWEIKGAGPDLADAPATATVTEDAKLKATNIEADLAFENLPVHEVALAFADANFLRRVEVLARNCRTRTIVEPVENSQPRKREIEEPWTTLTIASVYRLPGGQGQEPSTGLTLPVDGKYRYLLVRVYNGDDAPLKFSEMKVRRLRQYVNFQAASAGPYQLYSGNEAATRPQYDLENFAERLRSEGVTAAKLGAVASNPLFAAPVRVVPWSERHAALLWTALGVVLVVLAVLVARQARQARAFSGNEVKKA